MNVNPTTMAAIIGASGSGIVAPTITWALARYRSDRKFERLDGRKKALLGDWKGIIRQEISPVGPIEFGIRITFSAVATRVSGNAVYEIPGKGERKLDFAGGFITHQLLKLDYTNPDDTKTQFGCYVAELDAEGTGLAGRFVGYGTWAQAVVFGTAKLTKV